jgi:hypothetical protein
MSSAHNPWKYNVYIEKSFSNADERTTMNVRPGFSPIQSENYDKYISTGSNIGFTVINSNSTSKVFYYNLYDENFYNEITYLGGAENSSAFHRVIAEQNVTHLLLLKTTRELEWANSSTTMTHRFENDKYVLYEVTDVR